VIRRGLTAGTLPGADLPEAFRRLPDALRQEVLYRVSYAGYLSREERQIEKLRGIESVRLPADLDYSQVKGLRRESALKLAEFRPSNLGQASRISGVNPADISILLVVLESRRGR
jgi:tRNA uridine 5-carboxymethylaminomethyl modification enzyme